MRGEEGGWSLECRSCTQRRCKAEDIRRLQSRKIIRKLRNVRDLRGGFREKVKNVREGRERGMAEKNLEGENGCEKYIRGKEERGREELKKGLSEEV